MRLNYTRVYYSTWCWIAKSVRILLLKEALVDSLIYKDQHELDILTSWQRRNSSFKLRKLMSHDSVLLGISNSISVDDYLNWKNSILSLKCF